ncbi:MAG: SH3 domain-containing protein, partial [Chloroflexi bacterium]|nr:SH3 domain-containing protein [Chloroflexota bacterium]
MKRINLKTAFTLILAGATAALMAACSGAEPQVLVVTATPTATPVVVIATPEATPVVELSVKPTATVEAGALLRGNGEAVFYVTADGTRQHIADFDTFLAFGFSAQDIVNVTDAALKALPQAGELTRLGYDEQDHLYWIAAGRRWQVDAWQKVVERADYSGIEPARLDDSLQAALPVRAGFSDGMLLRAGQTVYYFNRDGLLPLPGGVGSEAAVVDVPAEMVGAYVRQSLLERAMVSLKAGTPAANVRRSPSLQAEIIGTVQNAENIVAQGRTADGHWLQIVYQGQPGWLAADLTVNAVALRLLPVMSDAIVVADAPEAEPAAVVEQSTPQPLFCTDVPIRGF